MRDTLNRGVNSSACPIVRVELENCDLPTFVVNDLILFVGEGNRRIQIDQGPAHQAPPRVTSANSMGRAVGALSNAEAAADGLRVARLRVPCERRSRSQNYQAPVAVAGRAPECPG